MSQEQTRLAPDPGAGDDAGFSIVEVVVAMTIFVILTVAVLGILVSALGGTRSNAQRVQAANLAAQQVEAVRSLRADQIPDGVTTPATSGTTVDGTTYTVTQSSGFLAGDGAASICTSTSTRPTFKRVTVSVTWPGMGTTAPVRSDTVVSVGLGRAGLDETRGIAAILVQDARAVPVPRQLVTLGPAGAVTTDDDGCAVFTNLAPGSYSAVVDTAGWVDVDGVQRHVAPISVVAGEVRRVQVDYDRASTLNASFTTPSGYAVPTTVGVPVTASFPLQSGGPRRALDCADTGAVAATCVSGPAAGPRQVGNLFPGTYTAWAGTCADAEVAGAPTVKIGQGLPSSVALPLAGARINVQGPSRAGERVYALHTADASCSGLVWDVGAVPTSGRLQVALPQGRWTFSLDRTGVGGSDTETLTAGSIQNVAFRP